LTTSILTTKLYIPPTRPNLVPRQRLLEKLDKGLQRKLTLISAPAGFGKTTLVTEWLDNLRSDAKIKIAWLSLDEGDNDLVRFLTYLLTALNQIKGLETTFGKGALRMLQSPQSPSIEAIITSIINEFVETIDKFIFVLDDYHTIDSKSVDKALTFLLEHLPSQMHLVITTREDPRLPLARLRARGQLLELRASELRFTPAESAEFLNQVMDLNLSSEDIAALETRTEGWIAGLQLAALSMQGRSDTASFVKAFTGSHHFVLDYLVEEVLQRQPEGIRNFLLQTSILDRICGALGDAVTGQEDGKETLGALERENLFIVPLDDQRQWYRYHHLFADVLQAHLMEEQPGHVSTLHRRASKWYQQNDLRPDAIRHALAAKDNDLAASLIELAWPAAEKGSIQQVTWLGWVKALPDELVHTRPVLNVWYAYTLLGRGDLEAAEARLKDAEQWLEPTDPSKVQLKLLSFERIVADQEQLQSLPAAIAIGLAYIAQTRGNILDTVRYATRVLELPKADPFRHSQAAMLLGMTYWASGDLEAANRVFADYTVKLRTAGNIPDAISTTAVLADIKLTLGRLNEAIDTVEQCLLFVLDQGEPTPLDTADLHRILSELYLEQGNLKVAARHLQRSKEMGEKAQIPVLRYRLCIAQSRFNETQGDLDGALASLDAAERLYIRSPLPDFRPISSMKARIWAVQGRLTQALEWVHEQKLSPDDDLCFMREFEHFTLARILIAQYENDQVDSSIYKGMKLLERLLNAAEEGGRIGSVIEILILQALANHLQGNIQAARVSLEHALALAEPQGYVRIFINAGKPIQELLTRIEAKNGASRSKEYILKLLSAFDFHKDFHPFGSIPAENNGVSVGSQPLIDPLSERELDVLKLLRSELSGPEIARDLMVALSTIRTHTQRIYAKLGVNNRRAAIRRAEELNLF
jgi:LuxR family transcriptional regulator, maltose regulon positive regulatory protein